VNARNTAQRHKKDTEHIMVNKTVDTGMQSVFILVETGLGRRRHFCGRQG